jgi:hypothetical protein
MRDWFCRTYYFYEFGVDKEHVAVMATVNSGKVFTHFLYVFVGSSVLGKCFPVFMFVSVLGTTMDQIYRCAESL